MFRLIEEQNREEGVSFEGSFSSQLSSMRADLQRFSSEHAEALDKLSAQNGKRIRTFINRFFLNFFYLFFISYYYYYYYYFFILFFFWGTLFFI